MTGQWLWGRRVHDAVGLGRNRLAALHADKGGDDPRCRRACRRDSIKPRIDREGVEPKTRLGNHRWVAQLAFAWIAHYRRFQNLAVDLQRHSAGGTRLLVLVGRSGLPLGVCLEAATLAEVTLAERTNAGLRRFRRPLGRHERRVDLYPACVHAACTRIVRRPFRRHVQGQRVRPCPSPERPRSA